MSEPTLFLIGLFSLINATAVVIAARLRWQAAQMLDEARKHESEAGRVYDRALKAIGARRGDA
jgi:hypothetical protein